MKKTLLFLLMALVMGSATWAQQAQKVNESDVAPRFVQDFQKKQPKATQVTWFKVANDNYRVDFRDADGDAVSILFGNKGTETLYLIPSNCYPAFIRDTIAHNANFAGYSIDKLYAREVKNTLTYQARVVKKSGMLWWRRVTAAKLVNFETTGKFLDATDE